MFYWLNEKKKVNFRIKELPKSVKETTFKEVAR